MPASPTKIVFFATQLYPLAVGRSSGFGGAETELWNVARGLAENVSYDVWALTLTDEIREPQDFGGVRLDPVTPAEKLSYKDSWFKRRLAIVRYYTNLYRQLRHRKADIYFSKLASSEASAVWLASRRARGKYVFRIEHDWETNIDDLTNIIFRGSGFWARIFLFCLKRADMVVVQTKKQAEALKDNYGVESVLIPNGHPMPPDSEIEHDAEKRPAVLWVARAHPMKRPQLFLDLAEKNPQYPFTMILAPSDEHQELFEQCEERAKMLSNVEFVPGVAPAEMDRFYQQARLFVLTSEAEGFSNVIIEALKNGAPTLSLGHNPNDMLATTDDLSLPAPAAGFYTADNMEATSHVLVRMCTDMKFWAECHGEARECAVRNFGLNHVVDLYQMHFERLDQSK